MRAAVVVEMEKQKGDNLVGELEWRNSLFLISDFAEAIAAEAIDGDE